MSRDPIYKFPGRFRGSDLSDVSTIQFHNNIYGEKKAFSVSDNCIEIRGEI
jgi:hypothetical protein